MRHMKDFSLYLIPANKYKKGGEPISHPFCSFTEKAVRPGSFPKLSRRGKLFSHAGLSGGA